MTNIANSRPAIIAAAIIGLLSLSCQHKNPVEDSAATTNYPNNTGTVTGTTPYHATAQSSKLERDEPQLASSPSQNPKAIAPQAANQAVAPAQAAPKGWNPDVAIPAAETTPNVTYTAGSRDKKLIALTFDDGPHSSLTPRLLQILRERNVKATFFVLGPLVKSQPDIVRQMTAEGHEVANHSWTHRLMTKASDPVVLKEFQDTHDAIVAACGVAPKVQRPPYGAMTKTQRLMLKEQLGYSCILWDVDPLDWKKPGASAVASRILNGTRNGSILLLHDIHSGSVDAVPAIVDGLLAQGYVFVTVSQLLASAAQ